MIKILANNFLFKRYFFNDIFSYSQFKDENIDMKKWFCIDTLEGKRSISSMYVLNHEDIIQQKQVFQTKRIISSFFYYHLF